MSADNRCLPGSKFHSTIPVAVQASGPLWCRSARCQLTIAASQQRGFHFTIPIMRLSAGLRCRSLRCQLTIAASQQRGFHFTIPIAVPHSGTPVQITSLSADNHCLPGSEFYSTIPVAVQASGHSGADQPVVSRQLLPARVRIPFHDTCSTSGQRVLRRRSARCQLTIAASQQRGFHFTIPIADKPRCRAAQNSVLSADNRCQSGARVPFHDTYSSSGQRALRCRSARCQPTITACQGQNSIPRYL